MRRFVKASGQKLKSIDQFKECYQIHIDQKSINLPTWTGACFSLLLYIVMLAYTIGRMNVYIYRKDPKILTPIRENFYSDEYVFNSTQGLNMAFALVPYGGDSDYELDPSIGKLVF